METPAYVQCYVALRIRGNRAPKHIHVNTLPRQIMLMRKVVSSSLILLPLMTGCIPFVVGNTARPVREGETVQSMSFYSVPNSFEFDSTHSAPRAGIDPEVRHGLDD